MYILAIVWILSAGICYYVSKKKNIKPTVMWNLAFVLLGPLAIPIILSTKKIELNKDVKNTSII
jgi:uncharacterized membrane protein